MSEIIITRAGLPDRAFIRSVSERTWPSTYGHIISQEQIDFMLGWMYSDASLEKQMNTGCEFYIASKQNDHGDIDAIGFCSVSPEEGAHKLNKLYVLPAAHGTGAGRRRAAQLAGAGCGGGRGHARGHGRGPCATL